MILPESHEGDPWGRRPREKTQESARQAVLDGFPSKVLGCSQRGLESPGEHAPPAAQAQGTPTRTVRTPPRRTGQPPGGGRASTGLWLESPHRNRGFLGLQMGCPKMCTVHGKNTNSLSDSLSSWQNYLTPQSGGRMRQIHTVGDSAGQMTLSLQNCQYQEKQRKPGLLRNGGEEGAGTTQSLAESWWDPERRKKS